MALPYFYSSLITENLQDFSLDEETSRHVQKVLRMRVGEELLLTDGQGLVVRSTITENHKKNCAVKRIDLQRIPQNKPQITVAISLLKNDNRFEWFLEKVTEIGIAEIVTLICDRTEKKHFRAERLRSVCIQAMIQSQQAWMPTLHAPVGFEQALRGFAHQQKFIAHCMDEEKANLADLVNHHLSSQVILVGPEGDFSPREIEWALRHSFVPVSLGVTRLRAETAGVVAATLLKLS
jgi:16S rRNA (uracil1498-N3)-methyltransferase